MDFNNALWILGIFAEAIVVFMLLYRGTWRSLKIFTFYCVWDLAVNSLVLPIGSHAGSHFRQIYLVVVVFDTALVFSVLTEILSINLYPYSKLLPQTTMSYESCLDSLMNHRKL